jgi:DeoR/GlpR family transcriptional regulator of sugar metabolism
MPPPGAVRYVSNAGSRNAAKRTHTGSQKQAASVCGAAAVESDSKISADLYLLGVAGAHPKQGFTTGDLGEAAMERVLITRASDTYVLASSEKLGTVARCTVANLSQVAGIITDAGPGHPTVQQFRKLGAQIIHAS